MTPEEALTFINNCIDLNQKSTLRDKKTELLEQTHNLPNKSPLQQRLWHVINNASYPVLCKNNGCTNSVAWKQSLKRYNQYCSVVCASADPNKVLKSQAWKQNPVKLASANAKGVASRRETNLELYGHGNYLASEAGKQIGISTKIKRYGENFRQHELQQRTSTMLVRYGVNSYTQFATFRQQQLDKWQDKYGGHPKQSHVVQSKYKATCLTRYGVENPTQSHLVQAKHRATCLTRYGVENPTQSHMINTLELVQSYDWLYNEYVTERKPAVQIAQDLGINDTTIGRYLKKAEIEIRKHHHSYVSIIWLEAIMESENIHIQHALNEGEYKIPGTRWKADGYCAETNTIYEFHGDYWHGNPLVYAPDVANDVIHKSMGELYQRTLEREEAIKAMGYNLIVKWESS